MSLFRPLWQLLLDTADRCFWVWPLWLVLAILRFNEDRLPQQAVPPSIPRAILLLFPFTILPYTCHPNST